MRPTAGKSLLITIAVCFVSEPIILLTLSVGVNNDKFYLCCQKFRLHQNKENHAESHTHQPYISQ